MGFAKAVDHVDPDTIPVTQLALPRPDASFVFRVKNNHLGHAGIFEGDYAIVERNVPLRSGRFAVASIDGETRLVQAWRDGNQTILDGVPDGMVEVRVLAVATRIIRVLIP